MTATLRKQRSDGVPESVEPFAGSQIIGTRERQEDDYAALDLSGGSGKRLLFVVADGMGGHQGAAAVTQLAVRRFCEIAQGCDGALAKRLPRALAAANDAIAKAGILDATLQGAGCAFLAAAVDDGAISWTSVGDCSLLLFRKGKIQRLNEDHSMRPVLAEMIATGRLSARTAALDPRRNSLRSALVGQEIRLIDHPAVPLPLRSGDAVILASDGLETLKHRAIAKILRRQAAMPPVRIVECLLDAVLAARARSQDNTTMIIYRFASPDARARPGPRPDSWRFRLWLVLAAVLLLAAAYGMQIAGR
jgi:serine/threonine protein phosphatase PrpC